MNAIQSIYGKSAVKENYLDKVGIVICKNYFDGFIERDGNMLYYNKT